MDEPSPPPPDPQALVNALAQQLAQWQALQTQLQELHARLEYARLMLKIHTRQLSGPGG
jgi:DNA-binding ferritin-like protein